MRCMGRVYYQKKPDKAFILLKYDKKNPECGEDYIRSPLTRDAQPGRFLMKLNSIFPTLHSALPSSCGDVEANSTYFAVIASTLKGEIKNSKFLEMDD